MIYKVLNLRQLGFGALCRIEDINVRRLAFGEGARGCRKMDGVDCVDDAIAVLQEGIGLFFEVAHNRPNAEHRTPNVKRHPQNRGRRIRWDMRR